MARRVMEMGYTPGWWASNGYRYTDAELERRRDAKRQSDGDWNELEAERELYELQMAAIKEDK